MRVHISGDPSKTEIPCTSCSSPSTGTSQPFLPCSITSSIPCPRHAITGLPQDMASRYTHPRPSLRLAIANMEHRRTPTPTSYPPCPPTPFTSHPHPHP